jgi:CRP/FNR family transcriptional regulator
MSEVAEKLRDIPFFSSLEPQELEVIASTAVELEFNAGKTVFWEGDVCEGIYLVESGWLKAVKVSLHGREQVIRFLRPGEMFNEVAFFSHKPNLVSVISLEPSRVWLLEGPKLAAALDSSVAVCKIMLEIVSERVQHMLQMIEDLSFRSVEARLARAILHYAEENVASRRRWSTQAEMAAHFGTVPDVLNREIRSLVEKGLIEVERTHITILDEEGLKRIAMLTE